MDLAIQDMERLTHRCEISVARGDGKPGTSPLFIASRVELNGINGVCTCPENEPPGHPPEWYQNNPGDGDDSCEPFIIDGDEPGWHFCKTERNPYDTLVVACLLAAKHHMPKHFYLESEGRWGNEFLQGASKRAPSGVAVYEHVFPSRSPVEHCLGTPKEVDEERAALFYQRLAKTGKDWQRLAKRA